MEGSAAAAGVASGDAGQQNGGAQNGEQGQPGGPDVSALTAMLDAITPSLETQRAALQAVGPQHAGGHGDADGGEPIGAWEVPDHVSDAELHQHLSTLSQTAGAVDEQVAAATAPLREQLREQATEADAAELVRENEHWGDPAYAHEMLGLATNYAQQFFPAEAEALAANPKFWRLISLAHAGAEATNAQAAAEPPRVAHVEGGGGAAAGGGRPPASRFAVDESAARLPF